MAEEIKVTKTLDTRNMYCPLPVVKLSGAIKGIAVNEIVEVLATDPGTLADLPNWARSTGNEIVKQSAEGNVLKFYIKRRV